MHSVFVQDTWKPTRKLTVNAGLRIEKVIGGIPAECQAQTVFVNAQCYPEMNDVPNFTNLSPRTGLIYDVFGDGKTALKVAFNRYLLPIGPDYAARVNSLSVTSDTRPWTDRNNDLIPQLNELGASTGFNLGSTNRYAAGIERPYANEFVVELQRQMGSLVVSAGYYYRASRRAIGSANAAVPFDSYIPLHVVEGNSGTALTVYNQAPATRGKFDTVWDNYPALNGTYNGVDVTISKRMSNRWSTLGGVSIGRNTGDIYGTSDLNNPNFTFRQGLLSTDVPFSLKESAVYQALYGIDVAASLEFYKGFPERDTVSVGSNTVILTQVTQSVVISPSGMNRLPDTTMIDLSIKRSFKVGHTAIEPAVNVFNLANANTVSSRITTLGSSYHVVGDLLRGRMVKFGLNVNF
jgi:hypothetical protein